MKNICVVGVGYVGIITAACFADLGNKVVALDIDQEKIADLKNGKMPIYEPGLKELIDRNVEANRIRFTHSYEEGLKDAEFAFIAVGTPSGVDGEADLQYVASAARSIADHINEGLIIINKSTVPVGTGDWVSDIVREQNPDAGDFAVVSCPEFLREGSAISDFMQPHRIVIGSLDEDAADKVAQLHLPLRAPIVVTDLRTAEMIKYASNAFLATKISFINEIANICEDLGADVLEVSNGMGYDARIGSSFLNAGIGYGGSCFPKDVKAMAYMAEEKGRHPQLLNSVMEINTGHSVRNMEAPVRLPSPPIIINPSIPWFTRFFAAFRRPSLVLNSWQRAVPIIVPPRCKIPPTDSQVISLIISPPSTIPWYPSLIPYTSIPRSRATRTTDLIAAFMPGASPPLVRIPILFITRFLLQHGLSLPY